LVFKEPEHIAGELRAVLPAELSRQVDWSTLKCLPSRLRDPQFDELEADLLFEVHLRNKKRLLLPLVEHQSSSDYWMALRLQGYITKIWFDERRTHPTLHELTAIIPIVVYHGESPWSGARSLHELIATAPEDLAPIAKFIPNFAFVLDDLPRKSGDELRDRHRSAKLSALGTLALLCLSRIRNGNELMAELEKSSAVAAEILTSPSQLMLLGALLRYTLEQSDIVPEKLHTWTAELGPKAEEAYMTGAQMLTAEAEARGKAEGKADTLLLLLETKFGPVSENVTKRVRSAKTEQLDSWIKNSIRAKTLDEVFAD
jgi:hypothetical protein